MSGIEFYEVVEVLASSHAVALGVGRSRGIVVGTSGEGNDETYAVLIGGSTFMLGASDLVRTGERVDREAVYGGESVRISPERYEDNDG